jgi:hypothetical protein
VSLLLCERKRNHQSAKHYPFVNSTSPYNALVFEWRETVAAIIVFFAGERYEPARQKQDR